MMLSRKRLSDREASDPGPAAAITSGATFSFQAWYRDPTAPGATYDASDAVRVTFN